MKPGRCEVRGGRGSAWMDPGLGLGAKMVSPYYLYARYPSASCFAREEKPVCISAPLLPPLPLRLPLRIHHLPSCPLSRHPLAERLPFFPLPHRHSSTHDPRYQDIPYATGRTCRTCPPPCGQPRKSVRAADIAPCNISARRAACIRRRMRGSFFAGSAKRAE